MKIGFHLPIAKGLAHTHKRAAQLGCEVAQIFVKNPRSWAEKAWSAADIEAFGRLFRDLPVVAHLSYLPNIARCDEDPRNLAGLLHEADLCTQAGIETMIVHCGSRENVERGIESVARAVGRVLASFPLSVLFEHAAGQGTAIGKNLPELIAMRKRVQDNGRTVFCLTRRTCSRRAMM